ncbi:hypothetical protein [Streptomyces sp. NPDC086838]|jgi:hypothetical protein|uniref:hypothetical protein n=1 Tax=Streptomyces sp. NPDC086838 TaxID=3365762 RepID=UPI0037FEE6F5
MKTVFATEGGRRFHQSRSCCALADGQSMWRFDPQQWVPGMPQIMLSNGHSCREMSAVEAFGHGKEPCAECFPGQRAALYDGNCEDDFGHEPTCGISLFGLAETVCARCTERGVWYGDANELRPVHILWPCTSATVLGLAPRKEISA